MNNDITLSKYNNSEIYILKNTVILGNGHTIWVDAPGNQLIPEGYGSLSLGKTGEIEKSKLIISQTDGTKRDRALIQIGKRDTYGGILNIYDGVTIKNADSNGASMGSAILVMGTLNMYGGEITESSNDAWSYFGGAVGVEDGGTFNMYSGKIHNNTTSDAYGGGVTVKNGTFNMYGGEISSNKVVSDNKYLYGGGIALFASKATFGTNATITENIGTHGGGLYIDEDSQVTMDAGFKLINNKSKWGGGLLYEGNNPLDIKQGVIIANNTASKAGADIYTLGSGKITLSDASSMNQTLNGSNREITGWYYDNDPRWNFKDAVKVDITKPIGEETGIIAAYKDAPKHKVIYEFVSGTEGKELPQEITDLLPIDSNEYEEGATVKAIQPEKTTIEVANGTWIFKGYDAFEKVATSDVKFTGTWVFDSKSTCVNLRPVINAQDKTLTVGDNFDPKKDVTAFDYEDGDLTSKIEIVKNEVDTSKVGVYEVTYKVTDCQGAFTITTIKVTVIDRKDPIVPDKPATPDKPENSENPGIKPENPDKPEIKPETPDKPDKPGVKPETSNKADVKSDSPKTGDQINLGFFISLLIVSALGILRLVRLKKKSLDL